MTQRYPESEEGPDVTDPSSASVSDGDVVYHVAHAGSTPRRIPRQVTF